MSFHLPRLLADAGQTEAVGGGRPGGGLLGSPDQIRQLPPAVRHAVIDAFARSLHVVFLCAVPLAVAGFLLMLLIDEVPLRTDSGPPGAPPPVDEDAAPPASGDAVPVGSVT